MALETKKKVTFFILFVIFVAPNAPMLRTDSPSKCVKCTDELNAESKDSEERY